MHRYLCLIWEDKNSAETEVTNQCVKQIHASGDKWERVHRSPGMLVFQAGNCDNFRNAYRMRLNHLDPDDGVILGKLFKKQSDGSMTSQSLRLNGSETREILSTKGKHLFTRYWGQYIAFLHDQRNDRKYILRDPSGKYPVFFTSYRNVKIFFSEVEDVTQFGFLKFTINKEHINLFMRSRISSIRDTGIQKCEKIARGERLEIDKYEMTRSFVWNPITISQTNIIEDPEEAAFELRNMTMACVDAWASNFKTILHSLSGGLDSSIVLACLKKTKSPVDITCYNIYTTESVDADERKFARLAAKNAQVSLIEKRLDFSGFSFKGLIDAPRTLEPRELIRDTHIQPAVIQAAKGCNAEAIFSGNAGDNIFYKSHTSLGASDFANRYGLRPSLFRAMLESARLQGISIWSVLSFVLKHGILHRPWHIEEGYLTYKNPVIKSDIIESARPEDYLHPWFRDANTGMYGKLLHAFFISLITPSYFQQVDDVDSIDPLSSQPLVELCLRIPTWILALGGKDRGLARRAFRADVPRQIIARESKGGAATTYALLFRDHAQYIQDFLSNGYLAQQGILDLEGVERAFARDDIESDNLYGTLLDLMSTETWCRRWSLQY